MTSYKNNVNFVMARDPLIFVCHFVKGSFHQKISSRFCLICHDVEIPIRPHVKFQKIGFSD